MKLQHQEACRVARIPTTTFFLSPLPRPPRRARLRAPLGGKVLPLLGWPPFPSSMGAERSERRGVSGVAWGLNPGIVVVRRRGGAHVMAGVA